MKKPLYQQEILNTKFTTPERNKNTSITQRLRTD